MRARRKPHQGDRMPHPEGQNTRRSERVQGEIGRIHWSRGDRAKKSKGVREVPARGCQRNLDQGPSKEGPEPTPMIAHFEAREHWMDPPKGKGTPTGDQSRTKAGMPMQKDRRLWFAPSQEAVRSPRVGTRGPRGAVPPGPPGSLGQK